MPLCPPDLLLSDGVVEVAVLASADFPAVEQAAQVDDIADAFGLVNTTASEYAFGYANAWLSGTAAAFAIRDVGGSDCVGNVLLELRHRRIANCGYWLLPQARRSGRATRALRLVSRWALMHLELARLQLWTPSDNLASRRVAEQSGFQQEGVLRAYGERRDGSRVDAVFFSLLPGDVEAA